MGDMTKPATATPVLVTSGIDWGTDAGGMWITEASINGVVVWKGRMRVPEGARVVWRDNSPQIENLMPTEVAACAGRAAVAHDRTPMVDGACPVCGERETDE